MISALGAALEDALPDRYALGEEIGRGGMAIVYRARDLHHDRDVAIKVLRPELSAALGSDRFLREIQIESRLQHPHILTLHDSGEANGILFYVMPFVEGESLRDRLKEKEQLTVDETVSIARDIGSALSYAHEHGIVHRDLKPENILMSSGHAILADFGIAQAIADAGTDRLTESGLVVGTPEYMSPEQGGGSDHIDGRSDIYSFGCIVFEMLCGEPPFTGRTAQAVIARHMHERLPSLEIVRPETPRHVNRAVAKALAKSPADRFATVDEFIKALETPLPEPSTVRRRLITSAITLVAVGVVAWIIFGNSSVNLDSNKVVGFPLSERGLPVSQTGAGYTVARLIEVSLEHADPLKWIDPTPRLSQMQVANPQSIPASLANEISLQRGAPFYITGTVQGHGDSTTVILSLWDAAGDSLIDRSSASGLTAIDPLHHLGIDAVKALLPRLLDPGRRVDLASVRNLEADAIALWIQGERAYRHGQFRSAVDFYQRAVEVDSGFAFAAVKGAEAYGWMHQPGPQEALLDVALRSENLPRRYRLFARGIRAYLMGEADSAVYWLEAVLADYPDMAEASTVLGGVYYHLLPARAPLDSLATASFLDAVRADSTFVPPLFHLTQLTLRSGDIKQADILLSRFEQAEPETHLPELQLIVDCARAGPASVQWPQMVQLKPLAVYMTGAALAVGAYHPACAEAAFRSLLAADSSEYHWGSVLGLQSVLAAQGRNDEVEQLIDSVVTAGALPVAMTAYVADVIAGAPLIKKAVEVEEFGRRTWGDSYESLNAEGPRDWLFWLFGAWHAHRGDAHLLGLLHNALAAASSTGKNASRSMYAMALAGHTALLEGDTATAIFRFQNLISVGASDSLAGGIGSALAVERFRLSQLLLSRGEYAEALRVASVFDHPTPLIYVAFIPASLVIRYEAALGLGRNALAVQYRERLVRLGRLDLLDSR